MARYAAACNNTQARAPNLHAALSIFNNNLYLQGLPPCRVWGGLISFEGELYVYGGMPSDLMFHRQGVLPFFSNKDQEEHFMMKLDNSSYDWKPVSYAGAPENTWEQTHSRSTGATPEVKLR